MPSIDITENDVDGKEDNIDHADNEKLDLRDEMSSPSKDPEKEEVLADNNKTDDVSEEKVKQKLNKKEENDNDENNDPNENKEAEDIRNSENIESMKEVENKEETAKDEMNTKKDNIT